MHYSSCTWTFYICKWLMCLGGRTFLVCNREGIGWWLRPLLRGGANKRDLVFRACLFSAHIAVQETPPIPLHLIPTPTMTRRSYSLFFLHVEHKSQRGWAICPKSHSWWNRSLPQPQPHASCPTRFKSQVFDGNLSEKSPVPTSEAYDFSGGARVGNRGKTDNFRGSWISPLVY